MSAYDRKNTIENIKNELKSLAQDYPNFENVPPDRRITVVSTSLIEAGVDLDFYCVYRELTGLDSILQAGGRCNREGKRKNAEVFIFSLDSESKSVSSDERANITKGLLEEYDDISCSECIRSYYDRLFFINKENIIKNSISEKCSDIRAIPFSEYAKDFEIIDSKTVSVVVERDDISRQLIENIKQTGYGNHRKLQKYAFTIYRYEFDMLFKQHVIDDYKSGIYCLTNSDYYDENIGVIFEAKDYFID
jgi:CRISPR-associated endonuclease/helicase Cas3